MIGILTFQNTRNYGALMQCYALQKYLLLNNVDCEVINYNNEHLLDIYNLNPFHTKNIKSFIKKTIMFPSEFINQKTFNKFKKENIMISKIKYDETNIKDANKKYNSFISGSDQVWNFDLSGYDKNYFLDFCFDNNKKNSYAASFGSGIIKNEYLNEVIDLLKKQNMISIRESETIEYLKNVIPEVKCVQSIDPVFLLDSSEWKKFITKKNSFKNYIFVYEVARTPNLREYAYYLSKKLNKKVIFLSKSKGNIKNAKKLKFVSPKLFLNLIYYADVVLTSSFHGMAFSLIFEKNFLFDLPKNHGEFGSRLCSLSKISGTENKEILSDFEKCDLSKINYNIINNNLKKEIEESKDYLKNLCFRKEQ